jgi:hypothetical protein
VNQYGLSQSGMQQVNIEDFSMKQTHYSANDDVLIVKADTELPYTILPNAMLQDNGLSLVSRGLLSMLLSMPARWHVRRSWLCANCIEGRRRIDRALQELQQAGYVQCEQFNHGGCFRPVTYRIYPIPQEVHRDTGSGTAVKGRKASHNGNDRDTAFRTAVSGTPLLYENKQEEIKHLETTQSFPLENDLALTQPDSNIPFLEIVGQYNAILAPLGCQRCLKLTQKRRAAIRRRWKEYPELQSVDAWSTYFTTISTHPDLAWLLGNNGRDWTASIDYLTSERGFLKVIEQAQSSKVKQHENGKFQSNRESLAERARRESREYLQAEGISADDFAYHCGLDTTH